MIAHLVGEVKEFARREPVATVAVACGVGLLVHLLPNKWVAGAATALGAMLVRPVILSLGLTKAVELCQQRTTACSRVERP